MANKDSPFRVYDSGHLYAPKYNVGTFLKRRGERISGKVIGITFYIGLKEFGYWLKGYGNDIPEDQLYKPKKRK